MGLVQSSEFTGWFGVYGLAGEQGYVTVSYTGR